MPEVVAEIPIEQHAMREDIAGLRQEMKEEIGGLRQEVRSGLAEMAQTFNNMSNAVLDAMNRGNDRYERSGQEIDLLRGCLS